MALPRPTDPVPAAPLHSASGQKVRGSGWAEGGAFTNSKPRIVPEEAPVQPRPKKTSAKQSAEKHIFVATYVCPWGNSENCAAMRARNAASCSFSLLGSLLSTSSMSAGQILEPKRRFTASLRAAERYAVDPVR